MFDLNNMMGKIQEAQQKMKQAQENLSQVTTTSESGAGMVKVTVNGHRKVLNVDIDASLLNENDKEMVQDLVVAAMNKAIDDIEIKIREEMKKSTDGVLPNIPGFDLSKMM